MKEVYRAWLIWGIAALFYFYEFVLQVSPGVLAEHLVSNYGISSFMLGLFGSAYYYTYAPMQIPAGILIDKYGPKSILTLAISCCLLGVFIFCVSSNFNLLIIARAIIGFGSAFAMIGTLKLASNWFSEDKFAFIAGLTYLIGMSGALTGKVPLDIFLDHTSWRTVFISILAIGLLVLVLFLYFVKDIPESFSMQRQTTVPVIKDFFSALKSPQIWLIAIYSGLMMSGILSLGALWGEQYLIQAHAQSKREAATLISFLFIGYAIGAPLVGKLSDKLKRRKLPLMIGSLSATIFYACLIYLPYQHLFLLFAFLFGVSNSFTIIVFPLAKEISHENIAASAIAFTNFITMLIGAFGEFLIGVLLNLLWSGQYINDIPKHTVSEFHGAFLLFLFTYFIAFFVSCFIKETYTIQSI